ncbi:MAG: hypothetical protein IJW37_10495 [Lachnospiraceae bacterium]|nr:hypothetical protein [Lachnospiraceae bacterium]
MAKKKGYGIAAAILLLGLVACKRESNGLLLNDVIPNVEKTVACMAYRGEDSVRYEQTEEKETERFLEKLDRVEAKEAADWSSDLVTLPIYGVAVWQKNEDLAEPSYIAYGYWSNGYWIAADGTAYEFDADMEELIADCAWETEKIVSSSASLIGAAGLLSDASGWKKELLTEAAPVAVLPGMLSEVRSVENNRLTVYLNNQGEEPQSPERYAYRLEVSLDGVWYEIPMKVWERAFKGDVLTLNPGVDTELSYSLSIYDTLPDGTYRLVTGSGDERVCLAAFSWPVEE